MVLRKGCTDPSRVGRSRSTSMDLGNGLPGDTAASFNVEEYGKELVDTASSFEWEK